VRLPTFGTGEAGGRLTTTATPTTEEQTRSVRRDRTGWWYVGAVAAGSVLMTITAIQQPFNQNELRQIAPYGSDSIDEITGGTRQPPLAPLIGAAFQHLFGEGQLQQRLEPLLAGIATLVVTAFLLRRLRLGYAGALGMWVMATAPLIVRHAAYTRPYMLPIFFVVLFTYSAQRWVDERHRGWLVVAALAAAGLPLSRVPEALVFEAASLGVLGLLMVVRRFSLVQSLPLMTILTAALVFVGYPQYRALAAETSGKTLDLSPDGVVARFDTGVHELVTYTLPLMAEWLPWWPISLLVIVTSLAFPPSRQLLLRWWWFWPVLAAPVVFLLAYHFLNPFPFWIRHYRPRYGAFFAPPYVFMVVALAAGLRATSWAKGWIRTAVAVLLLGTVAGQLPATGRMLVYDDVADYGQVADVLTQDLPDDAVVLYDVPSPVGVWGQPFSATPRYMGNTPYVGTVDVLARRGARIPRHGPVYVLMLRGECAWAVDCNLQPLPWRRPDVAGWTVKTRFDWFTLYAPEQPEQGWTGVIDAGRSFGKAMGPRLGYSQTLLAANLLERRGHSAQARNVVSWMYEHAGPEVAARIRAELHGD